MNKYRPTVDIPVHSMRTQESKCAVRPVPLTTKTKPQPTVTEKPFLTLKEAGAYAGCSSKTIRRAVRAKRLLHHRFGQSQTPGDDHRKIFIRSTDLERWIEGCRL